MDYGAAGTAILLFGDDPLAIDRVRELAGLVGIEIRAQTSIADAAPRLDAQASRLPVVAVIDGLAEAATLLVQLSGQDIILAAPAQLDYVWTLAPEATLLVSPSDADLLAALAVMTPVESVTSVREHSAAPSSLRHLSEEVGRIARALAALSEEPLPAIVAPLGVASAPPTATMIRTLIRARRLRDRFFEAGLFADPAWDMLLDLMAARLEGVQVAVSSLCIAAAVPTTTALRWIKVLTEAELLVRVSDPSDGRRSFIALADSVADALSAYFAELQRQSLATI
jgi:hypothetical protein